MTQKHLYTIINKEGKYKYVNYHNLGVELIKKLPVSIRQPLKILLSNTKADSIVIVTDLIDKEKGIIKELDIGDRIRFPMIEPSKKRY